MKRVDMLKQMGKSKIEKKAEGKLKRLANLRPWKKGDPRIPRSPGRPKTRAFAIFVREYYETSPNSRNILRLVKSMEKRCPAELAHYLAGKPVTTVELSGKEGQPLQIEHMTADQLRLDMISRGELDKDGRFKAASN